MCKCLNVPEGSTGVEKEHNFIRKQKRPGNHYSFSDREVKEIIWRAFLYPVITHKKLQKDLEVAGPVLSCKQYVMHLISMASVGLTAQDSTAEKKHIESC